jgi:prepilin-type N-terminal cleavage/methylation domain-containing protein
MWRRNSRRGEQAGFTLLELIVTMFVIALTMALAVPVIGRSSDAIRARAEVAGFAAVLRHARERAITSRQPHAVIIDPAAHRMTIRAGGTDGEVRETKTLPERLGVEATPPPALSVRFEPEGTSSGASYKLTAGDVIYRVTVDSITGRVKSVRL